VAKSGFSLVNIRGTKENKNSNTLLLADRQRVEVMRMLLELRQKGLE